MEEAITKRNFVFHVFACWKISVLWLMLRVSRCRSASWILSKTGIQILQPSENGPGRAAWMCLLLQWQPVPSDCQPLRQISVPGIIIMKGVEKFNYNQAEKDRKLYLSKILLCRDKTCQAKARCGSLKLSPNQQHSLCELHTIEVSTELNCRRCWGNSSLSQSSH